VAEGEGKEVAVDDDEEEEGALLFLGC